MELDRGVGRIKCGGQSRMKGERVTGRRRREEGRRPRVDLIFFRS